MGRIDRNNYDPERVLEIVRDQTDHDKQSPIIGSYELLRLLEESAHAYALLRDDTRLLYNKLADAWEYGSDRTFLRRLGWRR